MSFSSLVGSIGVRHYAEGRTTCHYEGHLLLLKYAPLCRGSHSCHYAEGMPLCHYAEGR